MSFTRFLREAEPNIVSSCSSCGTALRRSRSVWVLLIVGALAAAVSVGFAVPFAFARWGAGAAVLAVFTLAVAAVSGLKLCGWLLIGWEAVAADDELS